MSDEDIHPKTAEHIEKHGRAPDNAYEWENDDSLKGSPVLDQANGENDDTISITDEDGFNKWVFEKADDGLRYDGGLNNAMPIAPTVDGLPKPIRKFVEDYTGMEIVGESEELRNGKYGPYGRPQQQDGN
jgi:hypothetical protein